MYHLDFETYSDCDISHGEYRYACDPSTRILMCAISEGDSEPILWDSEDPASDESVVAMEMIERLSASNEPVYAHNASFEAAISMYCWERTFGCPPPKLEQWRCTAAMCRRAAIPWSLAKAADFLRLPTQKDKAGKRLIQLFSVPQERVSKDGKVMVDGRKMTRAEAWEMFKSYCRQDVVVERLIHERLAKYELTGDALRSFQFDLRMNQLGVPVDVPTLEKAQEAIEEYNERLACDFRFLTGLSPTQTGAVLAWLKERGYPGDDLQAITMEQYINHPALWPEAMKALNFRAALSFTAVKKVKTMLECACPDGRVRGGFLWHGASRTGRWSGKLVQFQNIKRPTISDTDTAYEVIKNGGGMEALELMYESPLEALASVVRNFIREEGKDFIDLDYSNIEGRVTGWLAGDEDLLDLFRSGVDVYKVMAGTIYGVHPDEVTKSQRFTGKTAVLGCGYGTGWKKFQAMTEMLGQPLDDKTCQLAVFKYRKARKPIVNFWRSCGDAAVAAIRNPGEVFAAGEHVKYVYGRSGGFATLIARLPSGRRLVYPEPRVETREITAEVLTENEDGEIISEVKTFTTEAITFYGPMQGSSQWGRVETHGSKLVENLAQSVAGDFLVHGLLKASDAGFEIPMVVHDQALAKHDPANGKTLEKFMEIMTILPPWAPGFPLKAEANVINCYTK